MTFGFGRIEFDGNVIDLDRGWTSFQPRRQVNESSVQADSGVEQTLTLFSQWFINARLNLLNPQIKAQLRRLFEYAENGNSFTLIRDRQLGTYIPFEGGINPSAAPRGLKTIDDIDGTFTRTNVADSAWYLDEGTGLLTLRDGANVPRFPAGQYGAGIQVDGAAANLIDAPSGPFDSGNWTALIGTASANTTETLDPAGTNLADRLTTAASGSYIYSSSTAVGNEAAGAVWLKSSSGTETGDLLIAGTTGNVSQAISITPVWQRFVVQGDTAAFTGNLAFSIIIDGASTVVYAWGAGLYDSALFDLGTIGATQTSSSITRNAEIIDFPLDNIVNQNSGTLLYLVNPLWDFDESGGVFLFWIDGTVASGRMLSHFITSSGNHEIRFYDGENNVQVQLNAGASGHFTAGTSTLIGITYDAPLESDTVNLRLYVDGMQVSTAGSTAFNPSLLGTNFNLGSPTTANSAFCTFDEVLVLRDVLTASEVAGLFNLGRGLGVQRNRWTVKFADSNFQPEWLSSDIYDVTLRMKEVLT